LHAESDIRDVGGVVPSPLMLTILAQVASIPAMRVVHLRDERAASLSSRNRNRVCFRQFAIAKQRKLASGT
jgi:hypothetical protein